MPDTSPAILVGVDDSGVSLPLGSGAEGFEAVPLRNAQGNHAILIRDADRGRALVTLGEDARAGRVLVTPLDDGVELRTDRDAAAQWIALGSVARQQAPVPAWASLIGLAIVLGIVALTLLGSLSFFGWLFDVTGLTR